MVSEDGKARGSGARPRTPSQGANQGIFGAHNQGEFNAQRQKTLKGLTPYEFICKRWTSEPDRFMLNPLQQMPGLNI